MGDEGNAGFSHRLSRGGGLAFGYVSQAEAMADRDLAAQAQRAGAGTDFMDIEQPHLARLVQMDVETDAMSIGNSKNAVELALGVAINLQWVDAADQIGAAPHRSLEQIKNTGAAHNAALRKGDDLHARPIAIVLARSQHAVELRQATFKIDIDMGAQMCGAERHAFFDQFAGTFLGRHLQVW